MNTVSIEIGDREYELEVEYWQSATLPSREDPGADGEVEVADAVVVTAHDGNISYKEKEIALKEFVQIYADYNGIDDLAKAERKLMEFVYDDVTRQLDEEYDSRYD